MLMSRKSSLSQIYRKETLRKGLRDGGSDPTNVHIVEDDIMGKVP